MTAVLVTHPAAMYPAFTAAATLRTLHGTGN
jgi:hypothetical protein